MLMCQSLKYLNPTKIKIILTNRCINKYQWFVEILLESINRINTSWMFDIDA